VPSAFASDLAKLGLDPRHLPPLRELSPATIKKIMPSFSKSLGVTCEFCHNKNDFRQPTAHKRVAARMWDEFVVKLALNSRAEATAGAQAPVLYCDSCHGGKSEFLNTQNKKAVSAWMSDQFVDNLARTDGAAHDCATCHGAPFRPKFLATWHSER